MRLQSEQSDCGPTTLANVFEARLGPASGLTVDVCRDLCGYNPQRGVNAAGMRRGISRAGYRVVKVTSTLELVGALAQGYPCALLVDDGEHWIGALGLLGGRVLICDSAQGWLVTGCTLEELERRWQGSYGVGPGEKR